MRLKRCPQCQHWYVSSTSAEQINISKTVSGDCILSLQDRQGERVFGSFTSFPFHTKMSAPSASPMPSSVSSSPKKEQIIKFLPPTKQTGRVSDQMKHAGTFYSGSSVALRKLLCDQHLQRLS